MKADDPRVLEPCPVCGGRIPYGGGAMRDGERLHWGCQTVESDNDDGETRLPSGAYV